MSAPPERDTARQELELLRQTRDLLRDSRRRALLSLVRVKAEVRKKWDERR